MAIFQNTQYQGGHPCYPDGRAKERYSQVTARTVNTESEETGVIQYAEDGMKFHTHAGGTSAAEGKNGFTAHTQHGSYHVSPYTHSNGRHAGYQVSFAHTDAHTERHIKVANKIGSGLWHHLGSVNSPNAGKKMVKDHHAELQKIADTPV